MDDRTQISTYYSRSECQFIRSLKIDSLTVYLIILAVSFLPLSRTRHWLNPRSKILYSLSIYTVSLFVRKMITIIFLELSFNKHRISLFITQYLFHTCTVSLQCCPRIYFWCAHTSSISITMVACQYSLQLMSIVGSYYYCILTCPVPHRITVFNIYISSISEIHSQL